MITLFKYRPIGSLVKNFWGKYKLRPHSYTKKMFVNRELWFSPPIEFNDPFDCNLPLHVKGTNQEVVDYLNTMREKKGAQDYTHQVPTHLDSHAEWIDDGTIKFKEAFNARNDIIYNKSSCYCWSTNGKSIPMFAYYADGHKGLCAEFEFPDNHEAIFPGYDISCSKNDEFPDLNFLTLVKGAQGELVRSLIAIKANCWEHEGEYRAFRENTRKGNVKYDDSSLKRIILGAKTTEKHEQIVKSWLSDWKTEVTLSRAKPSDKEFKLIIEDIGSIGGK